MDNIEYTFEQIRKEPCAGMWICVRRDRGKTEYFHSDKEWRTRAGETAYFNSKDEIEMILKQ